MTVQPASRFGQDAPARIQSTAVMLSEASSELPEQTPVPTLIPFYPGGVITGDQAAAIANPPKSSIEQEPQRVDITFRQGDDVVIPLYVRDAEGTDMSAWEWVAQIRVLPYYQRTLVNEFTVRVTYLAEEDIIIPADGIVVPPPKADHEQGPTNLVEIFLPRELNDFRGKYAWELYSIGPADFTGYPEPVDWPEDEEWPPTTALKTWVYGLCTIQPRTTDTDVLPDVDTDVIPPDPNYPYYTPYNIPFVGPNGRVP